MINKPFNLFLLLMVIATTLGAQNSEHFFKTIPPLDDETPEWAKKMYSDNPNVKEVDYDYYRFYQNHSFDKTIHTQNYKFWRRNIDRYIDENGHISQAKIIQEQTFLQNKKTERLQSAEPRNGNWECIGPFETYNLASQGGFPVSWQANVYALDQSISDPNILFAGMESGGIFKTTDKGLYWDLTSYNEPFITVNDIKIAPSNSEIVYAIAQSNIYKTTSGGVEWENIHNIGANGYNLLVHPTDPNIVFCAYENGLLKTTDGGNTWATFFTSKCWDISFHPTNPDIVYLLKTNVFLKKCQFFKSIDGGDTWIVKDDGWYEPTVNSEANDGGARIAVTPAAPDKVIVGLLGESKADDNGWIGVYTSTDAGESWTNPSLPDGGPYDADTHQNLASINRNGTGFHQGFYNFGIAMSHNNPDVIWVGCLALTVSYDFGATWDRIGSYNSGPNDLGWVHPDIQDLHVLGDDIWVCSDGGLNYSSDELQSHESRKYGMSGSNFWGFGQGWNEDVLVGGRYHNGNTGYFQTYGDGNHLRLGGAEAATGYVNPLEARKAYFSDISTTVLPTSLGGDHAYLSKISLYPNEHYAQSYSSEVEFDPRYAHHFYIGNENKIWKSKNEGGLFEVLYDFGTAGRVLELEISRSNHDVMYAVFQNGGSYWDNCEIYKSTDGGLSWSQLPNVPTNRWRLEITLNPENENELWVISIDGTDGQKVYRTLDGGSSWENMSTSILNGDQMEDIHYQAGTDGLVYLATSGGFYSQDNTSTDWEDCGNGLPLATGAMEIKPFYRDSKMRMATLRGLWEMDFIQPSMPIAQPMTRTDVMYCLRDTVPFDCYSVLDHEGASWEWSFNPAPAYISSLTDRNPKVLFGEEGSFDVSLTITDGNGNTSTKTVANMVTIVNHCNADTIPGLAMDCEVTGDFAETGNFDITTNSFSLTAWVKPNGIQNAYTGIVMNNNDAAGLNFRENNQLGYHWPGGAWWWDSGLFVPEGVWSHVALVATPTSLTVYLDGVGATHLTGINETAIKTMLIGSYKGWGDRNYNGQIDEVCIWNRSLTQEEIRDHRHLTKEHLMEVDTDILAYYQFNETEGSILDKAGIQHASLRGGATRLVSTAPLGGGTSHRQTITESGVYHFDNTGFTVDLSNSGIYPNGEVVVSRIHLEPTGPPNTNPNVGNYWIVNNYGSNPVITSYKGIQFSPTFMVPSLDALANPSLVLLYQRPEENGHLNIWDQWCGAEEVTGGTDGYFGFGTDCDLDLLSQFFITSSDDQTSIVMEDGPVAIDPVGEAAAQFVELYPNPVSHKDPFIISNTGQENIRVKLWNADGKLVKDLFVSASEKQDVDVSALAGGTYFYLVVGESFMKTGRVSVF